MISIIVALALGQVVLKEEGTTVGAVNSINCTGTGVTCSRTGTAGTLSVTGGGADGGTDVTIGAFGAVPNANGASISGATQILTMQPADATNPGGVSLGNQTFPGVGFIKTWQSETHFDQNVKMTGTKSVQFSASTEAIRYATNYLTGLQIIGTNIEFEVGPGGYVQSDSDVRINLSKQLKFYDGANTTSIIPSQTGNRSVTLPDATGTLSVTPTCAGGEFVSGNGTVLSCSTPAGGGAPTGAQYWVGAADGTLSAEKDLSALGTGLVINTAGTPSAFAGTSCTNQFPRSLSASGAATCAGVAIADHTATGTPSATTFYRGDNTWATPAGGSGISYAEASAATLAGF